MTSRHWERIDYAIDGAIARITMNRPDARNAMDFLMLDELQEAFEAADRDDAVKVIVFAGVGKDFSSGHDPGPKALGAIRPEMRASSLDVWDPSDSDWDRKLWFGEQHVFYKQAMAMRDVSKPTIAQVQGRVIYGAVMNVAMCDIIVAADDATFRLANTELLNFAWDIGWRKAKELLWTGAPLEAAEAWRLGLVNQIVPADDLEETVTALAKKIAENQTFDMMLIKRSVNKMLDLMGQTDHFDYHFTTHQLWHRTDSAREMLEGAKAAREQGNLQRVIK